MAITRRQFIKRTGLATAALTLLLDQGAQILADRVKELVSRAATAVVVPDLASPAVDLGPYDALLGEVAA